MARGDVDRLERVGLVDRVGEPATLLRRPVAQFVGEWDSRSVRSPGPAELGFARATGRTGWRLSDQSLTAMGCEHSVADESAIVLAALRRMPFDSAPIESE